MLPPKYFTPPSIRALKFSASAPIVVSASTPMVMPEIVRKLRSLWRVTLRMVSMEAVQVTGEEAKGGEKIDRDPPTASNRPGFARRGASLLDGARAAARWAGRCVAAGAACRIRRA